MAVPNILNLIKTETNGDQTEDLTGGVLPVVDGSNLTGVIGNTYIAAVDPGVTDDGFSNSVVFSGVQFQLGQAWFNYTTEKLFNCVDTTAGKARWNENLQSFGSNFTFLGGSSPIPRGHVVRLDNSGSFGTLPIVVSAQDGDDGIVGIASLDVSGANDITFQVISMGTVKVRVSAAEPNWTRGDPVYLSTVLGEGTKTVNSRLIGYASRAAVTGTTLRDIFVGFGSGGGGSGGGDLHTISQNKQVITEDYTIVNTTTGGAINYNGMSAGPVTIDPGVTVTVPLSSRWVIV